MLRGHTPVNQLGLKLRERETLFSAATSSLLHLMFPCLFCSVFRFFLVRITRDGVNQVFISAFFSLGLVFGFCLCISGLRTKQPHEGTRWIHGWENCALCWLWVSFCDFWYRLLYHGEFGEKKSGGEGSRKLLLNCRSNIVVVEWNLCAKFSYVG